MGAAYSFTQLATCNHSEGSPMEDYKREFIEFMVESDVLKFGEFAPT